MMLVATFGAVALLLYRCKAPFSANTSISLTLANTKLSTDSANATVTRPLPLQLSATFPNQTRYTNGTTNSCQAEFDSWSSDWWSWTPTTVLEWVGTQTYDYPSTLSSTEIYDCTQKCGTICYAGPITTIISTTRIYSVDTATFGENPPYTVPRPNCTIGFDDCLSIQTSWSSAMTSYSAMPLEYQVTVMEPPPPACSACISTACTFLGMFGMSLYYWPITTSVSRDYCASEPAKGPNTAYAPDVNRSYVPTTTGPYATVDGMSMYQGNVYVSYHEPRVRDNCGQDVARASSGHNVLTIASKDLHSIRKFPHILAPFPVTWDLVPWPVNFDDFNPPTPFSAYAGQRARAQPGLDTSSCTIVKPDEFFPYMIMPPQIRDLDPNWKSCLYDKYAAFDPPIALHTRGNMFSSVDVQPTSIQTAEPVRTPLTKPAPGQSGGLDVPAATTRPGSPKPEDHDEDQTSRPSTQLEQPHGSEPTSVSLRNPTGPFIQPMPVVTVGSSIILVDPAGGLIIEPGLTLRNGDPPVTRDGTTISVGPSGIVVAAAEATNTIPASDTVPDAGQLLTVGSSVLSINPSGEIVIEPGLTLRGGYHPMTVDGTTFSIGASGVVVNDSRGTSTIVIPSSLPTGEQIITVGSKPYAVVNEELILGPKITLSMSGAAAIVADTTISIVSNGVIVVSSSRTSIIPIESKGTENTPQNAKSSQNVESAKGTDSTQSSSAATIGGTPMLHFLGFLCGFGFVLFIRR